MICRWWAALLMSYALTIHKSPPIFTLWTENSKILIACCKFYWSISSKPDMMPYDRSNERQVLLYQSCWECPGGFSAKYIAHIMFIHAVHNVLKRIKMTTMVTNYFEQTTVLIQCNIYDLPSNGLIMCILCHTLLSHHSCQRIVIIDVQLHKLNMQSLR